MFHLVTGALLYATLTPLGWVLHGSVKETTSHQVEHGPAISSLIQVQETEILQASTELIHSEQPSISTFSELKHTAEEEKAGNEGPAQSPDGRWQRLKEPGPRPDPGRA